MKCTHIGWRCMKCRYFMEKNLRYCPRCTYTVYEPVFKEADLKPPTEGTAVAE